MTRFNHTMIIFKYDHIMIETYRSKNVAIFSKQYKMHFWVFSSGFIFSAVLWKVFFLGAYKLLVLISFLLISSLSFTFYLRANFSWNQFYRELRGVGLRQFSFGAGGFLFFSIFIFSPSYNS